MGQVGGGVEGHGRVRVAAATHLICRVPIPEVLPDALTATRKSQHDQVKVKVKVSPMQMLHYKCSEFISAELRPPPPQTNKKKPTHTKPNKNETKIKTHKIKRLKCERPFKYFDKDKTACDFPALLYCL